MKLYRFSPIESKEQLLEAITYTHFACHKLCKQSFGTDLPVAGNLAIFCHYDDEFDRLVTLRNELAEKSDNPSQKYFKLLEPIVMPAQEDVPAATYTHLYIRPPDPYRHHVGDVDFHVEQNGYDELRLALAGGKPSKGARMFPRSDLDMIELFDPEIDVLAYVRTGSLTKGLNL